MAEIILDDDRTIEISLNPECAPNTVANFCHLVNDGFYNGLKIYRLVKAFVIQMGCPLNNGKGTAGYCIPGEFSSNGWDNTLTFIRGTVGLGRVNDYDSGSCQFFITLKDQPQLNGYYAAFGRVTTGMDVVDAVSEMEADDNQHAVRPISIKEIVLNKHEMQFVGHPVEKVEDKKY